MVCESADRCLLNVSHKNISDRREIQDPIRATKICRYKVFLNKRKNKKNVKLKHDYKQSIISYTVNLVRCINYNLLTADQKYKFILINRY